MTDRFEKSNIQIPQSIKSYDPAFVFYLILLCILAPPFAILLGLHSLSLPGGDGTISRSPIRAKSLITLSFLAIFIELILGAVYFQPMAENILDIKSLFAKSDQPTERKAMPGLRSEPVIYSDFELLSMLVNPTTDANFARSYFDNASNAINSGSIEPLPRYITTAVLANSEVGRDIIEDDKARMVEVERLIHEGLQLDGENPEREAVFDVIIQPLLMSIELEKGNIKEAERIYDALINFDDTAIPVEYLYWCRHWTYNILFEYWQIRDPDRSLDIAIEAISRLGWFDRRLHLGDFLYPFYGNLDNIFRLSLDLGREKEFFNLLDDFLETAGTNGLDDADIASIHFFLGKYLSEIGRWSKALRHCREAEKLQPDQPEYHFPAAKALYETGKHREAAEIIYEGAIAAKPGFLMNDIRFLFYDNPCEGVEFLLPKLMEHPEEHLIAANLAILAHRCGDQELAIAAAKLTVETELRSGLEDAQWEASKALSERDMEKFSELLHFADLYLAYSADSNYVIARILCPKASPRDRELLARIALNLGSFEHDPDFHLLETYFETNEEMGKTVEAFLYLHDLIRRYDREPKLRFFLAEKLHEAGELEESLEVLNDLLSMWEGFDPIEKAEKYFESPGSSTHWYQVLNEMYLYDVYAEICSIYREMGDIEQYDHYLFLANAFGPEGFEPQLLQAQEYIENGGLNDAGEILDNLSFLPEADDKNSDKYLRLMEKYARLESEGWVRERKFKPYK